MTDLLAVIIPILLVDVLNPVLFAVLIFAAGSSRPLVNSSAMLLGHTLAYICVGLVASVAIEKLAHRLANPQPVDFVIEFILGVACLYAAIASRGDKAGEERNPGGTLTPFKCVTYGAIVNFIGAPFALPYLAMIDQLLKADLSANGMLLILLGYNLAYALPFALVPGLIALKGEAARPILEKINRWLISGADLLMPWLMLALALFLLTDSLMYLITGKPLPV